MLDSTVRLHLKLRDRMPANTEKDPATIEYAKTLANTPWCDDYERMVSGVLYDKPSALLTSQIFIYILMRIKHRYNCQAQELVDGRFRARRFMHKYNSYFPDDATPESLAADREAMLRQHLGRVGEGVFIEPPLNIDYGCNISLGRDFYSNFK